jgi:pullulanase/glycogen debranching enzyme
MLLLGSFIDATYGRQLEEVTKKLLAKIISAKALDKNHIQIEFENENYTFSGSDVVIADDLKILAIDADGHSVILETTDLDYRQNYFVEIKGYSKVPVDLGVLLDNITSNKPLGFTVEGDRTVFRLFAPRAKLVKLALFEKHTDTTGTEYEMTLTEDGVWEFALDGTPWGMYYGFKVAGPRDATEIFRPELILADPYSKAVTTKNTYLHEAKSIIIKTQDYDWEGDVPLSIPWEDLVIYEMHVRDLTAHPSSGVREKGTYQGLVEKNTRGGINHVLELGVNAVELLPCQEFGNIEIPFGQAVNGDTNTWNPYARNHWGYMTSYFFAPESYYASGGTMKSGEYCGIHGQQVREFKDLVKSFHKEGIAVIMDVVYNHVSDYDLNPLKYVDKKYYFRLDPMMHFLSHSGCGNDLKTERPMTRRLILDSIKHWLEEYHLDGFRFDLAAMIDWQTVEQITEEAKKINPNVILIAEPWGGGKYDLAGFSKRDWASWNDLFRNGVKGQNAADGLGWIFGKYWSSNNPKTIESYIKGSTIKDGGPFRIPAHSINYLESHDDHTLGDFIRIGSGEIDPHEPIADLQAHVKLTKKQMKLNKLAAAFLLASQGPVMIGEGQEFARSKVIAPTEAPDPNVGRIDHNSYNKDNETNWLNFDHKELNRELFEYYRGLIELRRAHPAFRRTPGDTIQFLKSNTGFSVGYLLPKEPSGDTKNFVVLLNANPSKAAIFKLPEGVWRKVVDANQAGKMEFSRFVYNETRVPPRSAMILAY